MMLQHEGELAVAAGSDLFGQLDDLPADALLALIGLHRADPRPDKIDLGVGMYRNPAGETPMMRAVRIAAQTLAGCQDSKSYLGAEGDPRFIELLEPIVFGKACAETDLHAGVQTPGGTGALRLAADLVARARPGATVWTGSPTWPNHVPIFNTAGLVVRSHVFFDVVTQTIRFDEMLDALGDARAGDVLLLHGSCHNPSGTDFDMAQWRALAEFAGRRGLLPVIDLAYQGLGNGLDDDAAGLRHMIASLPEALVAYSCDKNFALYRERTGALWAKARNSRHRARARANMLNLARSNWSMPPDHGAALVRMILETAALRTDWFDELDMMRRRIANLRRSLAASHDRLQPLAGQKGMFSLLPIDRAAVVSLREKHGIYMADSGRINIAGLSAEQLPRFVAALSEHL